MAVLSQSQNEISYPGTHLIIEYDLQKTTFLVRQTQLRAVIMLT